MTARFDAWANAYEHERRVCADLHAAFELANRASLEPRARKLARRRLYRANTAHVKALHREINARKRLSRRDHDLALLWAIGA